MLNIVQQTATSQTLLTRHRRDTGAARGDRGPAGRPFGWLTCGAPRLDHWLRGPPDRMARPRACLGDAGPGGQPGWSLLSRVYSTHERLSAAPAHVSICTFTCPRKHSSARRCAEHLLTVPRTRV